MCEMLGNQYFLARKYSLAANELGKALLKNPTNKAIRRKLIICEIQKDNISKALDLFVSLVEEDVSYIIDVDPIMDDCPCSELVYDLEEQFDNNQSSLNHLLKLAMIWLYCDVNKSLYYLNFCLSIDSDNNIVRKIINHLTSYLTGKQQT